MIQKIIHSILRRRHFWRVATFSEIAELYASRMLRMIALSMASAFLSVYLYQNGYSVATIAMYWMIYFLFKTVTSLPVAAIAAWIGPKHGIFVSNLLFIPATIAYALLPEVGFWAFPVAIFFQGLSTSLYAQSHNIDFSSVKSVDHAGKELAYMNIIEKFTTSISPLVGGILALLFGPQFVLVLASIIFVFAALPLFRTSEPTLRHQRLDFSGFPWHLVKGKVFPQLAIGFDVFTSGTVWWLFTTITIIGIQTNNEVYATNGLLLSVILVAAIGSSYAFGKIIDRKKGLNLLRVSIVFDSLTHFMRPFITTPIAIAGLNVSNEAATTGYVMAYNRGIFDDADISGKRVLYLGIIDMISSFGAALAAGVLYMLLGWFDDIHSMEYIFYITAAIVLLIATARFPLYRK